MERIERFMDKYEELEAHEYNEKELLKKYGWDGVFNGVIEYFSLSDNTGRAPVFRIGIRNKEGKLRDFKMPIATSKDQSSIRLIQSEMEGQRATYGFRNEIPKDYIPISKLEVHSGKFSGMNYFLMP